jgi:hypothetical protein
MTDINHITVSRLAGDTLISLETGGGSRRIQTFRLTPQAVDQLLRELERSREIAQTMDAQT